MNQRRQLIIRISIRPRMKDNLNSISRFCLWAIHPIGYNKFSTLPKRSTSSERSQIGELNRLEMLARTTWLQAELNEKEGGRDQSSSISIHREEPRLRWISNERKQHRGKAKASRDRVRLLNRFSKRLRACNYKCWNHLIISIDSFARPTSSRTSHSHLRRAPFGRGRQSDGWTVLHRASQCTCSSFIRSRSRQTFFWFKDKQSLDRKNCWGQQPAKIHIPDGIKRIQPKREQPQYS